MSTVRRSRERFAAVVGELGRAEMYLSKAGEARYRIYCRTCVVAQRPGGSQHWDSRFRVSGAGWDRETALAAWAEHLSQYHYERQR